MPISIAFRICDSIIKMMKRKHLARVGSVLTIKMCIIMLPICDFDELLIR